MVANLAPKYDDSNICCSRSLTFSGFDRTLELKKVNKIWNYQPCNWVLSEHTKSLQICFPIYVVFHYLSKTRSTGGALHLSCYDIKVIQC